MKISVCGLGLIGASLARAYKRAGHTVYGYDKSTSTAEYAIKNGICDALFTEDNIPECDALLLAICPDAAISFLKDNAKSIPAGSTVIDMCGTKRKICNVGFSLAREHGFLFVGGHPMAGTENSGIKFSREDLFDGASMVLVLEGDATEKENITAILSPVGFGRFTFCSPEEHDKMIAYTSQLAHVVSNAYVKSPTAKMHHGYSAGSYKDLTRVAKLNENMWTELFLQNGDYLSAEIDYIINSLEKYKIAIESKDAQALNALLREGRILKEETDG